jgi:hypothetical protein
MADSPIVTRKSERMKDRESELAKLMGEKKAETWLSTQTKNDLMRLAMAGLSSTIAQFFVHGVETVKVRMQVEGNAARASGLPMKYSNVYTGAVYVYQHEGIAGLYKVGPRPRSCHRDTARHAHAHARECGGAWGAGNCPYFRCTSRSFRTAGKGEWMQDWSGPQLPWHGGQLLPECLCPACAAILRCQLQTGRVGGTRMAW